MWKKILIGVYTPLAIISLVLISWLLYYGMFLKDNFFLTTNFVDNSSFSEEDKFQIEINCFSNKKGNGEQVVEIKFNYYVDTSIPEKDETGVYEDKLICSSGVQLIGQDCFKGGRKMIGWGVTDYKVMKNCAFYETAGSLESTTAIVSVPEMNKFIWDINGQLCKISMKGEQFIKNDWFSWDVNYQFDTSALCFDLYNSVMSLSEGDHINLLNLSQYYHINLYDEESGMFEEEYNLNEEWSFVNVKVFKTDNGMVEANQSMFGKFDNNPSWSYVGEGSDNQLYWETDTVVQLDFTDFTYSTVDNSEYFLTLKTSCKEFYSEFKNIVFTVFIDVDEFGEYLNVVGFSESAFGSFEVIEITLVSSEECSFVVPFGLYEIVTTNVTVVGGV